MSSGHAPLRPQFDPCKRMEGGAEGAAQLAATVDLNRCLLMEHADLESLRDPAVLPTAIDMTEEEEEKEVKGGSRWRLGTKQGGGGCCGGDGSGGGGEGEQRRRNGSDSLK